MKPGKTLMVPVCDDSRFEIDVVGDLFKRRFDRGQVRTRSENQDELIVKVLTKLDSHVTRHTDFIIAARYSIQKWVVAQGFGKSSQAWCR